MRPPPVTSYFRVVHEAPLYACRTCGWAWRPPVERTYDEWWDTLARHLKETHNTGPLAAPVVEATE